MKHVPTTAVQRVQAARPKDVELFFDPQRPKMEQRLAFRGSVEIARFLPIQEIGDRARPTGHVFAELTQLITAQPPPSCAKRAGQHQQQGRENAPYPPGIETRKREAPGLQFPHQDARDQEAGDHKKHVHPDKASSHAKGMEKDDGNDGEGTKPIDVRAVGGGWRCRRVT